MLSDFMSISPATQNLKALILYLCFSAFSIKVDKINPMSQVKLLGIVK